MPVNRNKKKFMIMALKSHWEPSRVRITGVARKGINNMIIQTKRRMVTSQVIIKHH